MKPYANLHTHSTHSDGVYSPTEMVTVAKNEGYRALAITDHDAATAYPELEAACKKENMECLFGVEFSVELPVACHIVSFSFDPEYPEVKQYLADMSLGATVTVKNCFDEAVQNGNIAGITWEEVLDYNRGITHLCNNHVFRAMKAKGLVEDSEYMAWFKKNFRDQRHKYKPIYDKKTLPEIVSMVKKAGGFSICAHPSSNVLQNIDTLIGYGIEGLEVLHPDLTPEARALAYRLCMEKNLFVSGGSDHSGLCGGLYNAYPSEEALKASSKYIEPLSVGVCEHHFRELQARKIER